MEGDRDLLQPGKSEFGHQGDHRRTVTRQFSFFAIAFKHGSATFDAFAADQSWLALVRHAPVTEPKYKVSSVRLCVVNVCATNMYRDPQRSPAWNDIDTRENTRLILCFE